VRFIWIAAAALTCWVSSAAYGQLAFEAFELEHPAIRYRSTPPADAIAALNTRLRSREATLAFERTAGYLRSLLSTLDVPVESQLVVYSPTSLQGRLIRPQNPRVIYFNDSIVVAWVRGGFIEIASQDPRQGTMFYMFPQADVQIPQLVREDRCLTCHYSAIALGVPGMLVRSIPTSASGAPMPWLGNAAPDHRTPIEERWGGWYVTGSSAKTHLGNLVIGDPLAQELPRGGRPAFDTLEKQFPTSEYLSSQSDIAALLVFDHQMRAMNMLTHIGWEARVLAHDGRTADSAGLQKIANEIVDYLLFIDEAPLGRVRASSTFAEVFAAKGPRDRIGRSLRELDLDRRLMRYPCSYMIYSPAFDALPGTAKDAIYRRLWQVLSGEERSSKYSRLAERDRLAIIEILRDTKADLPAYFRRS
jgi:hypothetical protein